MWRQCQAVPGLLRMPSRMVRCLLVMLSEGPPIPNTSLESPEFAAEWGLLSCPLQRKRLLSTHLDVLQGLWGSPLPSPFQLFWNFHSCMHLPSPSLASFRSIIISFSEWISSPFPHPHSHLWSVLCHLASLLAEQSLSI